MFFKIGSGCTKGKSLPFLLLQQVDYLMGGTQFHALGLYLISLNLFKPVDLSTNDLLASPNYDLNID